MGKSKKSKRSVAKRSRRSASSSSSSSSSSVDIQAEQRQRIRRLERKISKLRNEACDAPIVNAGVNETIIPIFDPSLAYLSANEWSCKVDDLKQYHKWNDSIAFKLAANRLRGTARKWYDSLRSTIHTWHELKTLLLENFPHRVQFGQLLVEAANYVPEHCQNLGDYCFEKVAKLNKLNIAIRDEYIIDSVIQGLGNETLCLSARAANCKTVGELANYLSHVSGPVSERVGTSKRPYGPSTSTGNKDFIKIHDHKKRQNFKFQNKNSIACYNCGGNHRVANCQKNNKL